MLADKSTEREVYSDMVHTWVDQAEEFISKLLKGVPALPKQVKQALVQLLPLLAGLLALFWLWDAVSLFRAARRISELQSWLYTYSVNIGPSGFERFLLYVAALIGLLFAFALAWSVPKLLRRTREGWRLVFAIGLGSLVLAVCSLFLYGHDFDDFVWGVLGCGVGLYVLLQVKYAYTHKDGARRRAAYAPKSETK